MATLSDEQRRELNAGTALPVPVIDDQTQKVYYLIPSDEFEKIRALLVEEEFDPREMYPLTAKTAGDAGWNDPSMDIYDHYDEHRTEG
jgi:hypothetical protein